MNHFTNLCIGVLLVGSVHASMRADTPSNSVAYGIRVYSPAAPESSQALVSFPIANPSEVTEVYDLSAYNIMAATCTGDKYYLLHTDDGMLAAKFLSLDLNTLTLTEVKTYDWKFDLAAALIYTDMAYDTTNGLIYAAAYNLDAAEIVGDEPDAPFGIFTIDPATGTATLMGQQKAHAIVALDVDDEGSLYGIDETGMLWDVSKYDGQLYYDITNLGITPIGIQSMAYDYGKKSHYWASYSIDDKREGISSLVKITRNEDWEYEIDPVGQVGGNIEVIGLFIDSNPLPAGAPSVVTGLNVVAGESGALSASLSWVNPSKSINGENLQAISVKIYRDDEPLTTLAATPGKSQRWSDDNIDRGMHKYSVAVVNDIAEGKQTYTDELWIGPDVPAAPADARATKAPDTNTITVSWAAPTKGLHGGWIDASSLTYTVVRRPDGSKVAEKHTSTTLADNTISEIHGYYYEITPCSSAGEGEKAKTTPVVAGNPHAVPFAPDFNIADHVNQWSVFNCDEDNHTWYPHTTGWAGTYDVFFRYNPDEKLNPEAETNDWLISPPVNLEAGKLYAVKYDVRLLGELFPANTTLALGKQCDPAAMNRVLESLDGDINDILWTTHAAPFSVDETGTYYFGYQTRNAVPVQFYKFAVQEVKQVDLAAGKISGNTMTNVGTATPYEVTVTNAGFETVSAYTLQLVDQNERVVASLEIDEPLSSQLQSTVTIDWIPTAEGVHTIYPRVVAANDDVTENNTGDPLTVTVFGAGSMIHITDGTTMTGYAPIYTDNLHSAVQTIYTSDLLGEEIEKAEIKGLVYYLGRSADHTFHLDIAMSNVDKDDFTDMTMVAENQLTKVYEGDITITKEQPVIAISLQAPFEYTGGNLCIFTRHSSESSAGVWFKAAYKSASIDPLLHTCLYRSMTDPFDFSQNPNGAYRDLPNISLVADITSAGVDNISVENDSDVRVTYSRADKSIGIDGEYTTCRIYSVSGSLLGEYDNRGRISTATFTDGVVIVEILTPSSRTAKKLAL